MVATGVTVMCCEANWSPVILPVSGSAEGKLLPLPVTPGLKSAAGVSLDYLVGKTELPMDEDISQRVLTIQKFPEEDRNHILYAIDAMIRDTKARLAYS